MGRRSSIDEADLMARLSTVFREFGYENATLTVLSRATGLKRASLYHRFPDGKEQMAREVLQAAAAWLEANLLAPLKNGGTPAERIGRMVGTLDEFYSGGRQACLLNLLSSAHVHEGPFTQLIGQMFEALISALTETLIDAGLDRQTARARAERGVILLQGSLVLSRGTGDTRPFRDFLKTLPEELLGRRAA